MMEKNEIYLQFYDAYKNENKLYFSAKNFNGLFCYDLKNGQLELLAQFTQDYLWRKHLHSQIVGYKGDLYFIPYYGKSLYKFCLESKKLQAITLEKKTNNGISKAILYEGKIYLIPSHCLDLFGYYDPIRGKMIYVKEISAKIKEKIGTNYCRDLYFDLDGIDICGDVLILTLFKQNYFLKVNLKSLVVEKVSFDEKVQLGNVFCDDDNIWLTSVSSTCIYRYINKTQDRKKYQILTGKKYNSRPFWGIKLLNNKMVVVPFEEDCLYYYEAENDDWEKIQCDFEKRIKMVDRTVGLCMRVTQQDKEVYLYPQSQNCMWVLDENFQIKKEVTFLFPMDENTENTYQRALQEQMEYYKCSNEILHENELELYNYIKYVNMLT